MNWREVQEQTAEFFRSLGCKAEVEAKIPGARAEHRIDVWVQFRKFGLESKWAIECKHWASAVTKEKVLVLKSIVEDVGADRGVMISTAGFQSGAVNASKKTNITLTDLDGLKESAREELVASIVENLQIRCTEVHYKLKTLQIYEKAGPLSATIKPFPGVDGLEVIKAQGTLQALGFGFDQIRLKRPPYTVGFEEFGSRSIVVDTLESFISEAKKVIEKAERAVDEQTLRSQQAKHEPSPN